MLRFLRNLDRDIDFDNVSIGVILGCMFLFAAAHISLLVG